MSRTFTKLFASITESTIWVAPDSHLRLWVYLMANADQKGLIWGSIPGVASHARVPLVDAEAAIASFMSPDPYSRTKDFEGRRIEEIDGGWRLLNHAKYREMRDDEVRAEQNRIAQQRQREKKKISKTSAIVSQSQPRSAQAEAEAEVLKSKSLSGKPDLKTLTDLGVDEQIAKDWLAVRKAKRAPLTNTVLDELKLEAEKAGITVSQAVAICAKRSWQGFKASWNWREEPPQAEPGERRAVV